jgi:hypothetical protein
LDASAIHGKHRHQRIGCGSGLRAQPAATAIAPRHYGSAADQAECRSRDEPGVAFLLASFGFLAAPANKRSTRCSTIVLVTSL